MARIQGKYALLLLSRSKTNRPKGGESEVLDPQWYYVVRSPNHKVFSVSETFDSKANAKRSANRAVGKGNVYEHGAVGGKRLVPVT